jgi:hypothetical protein
MRTSQSDDELLKPTASMIVATLPNQRSRANGLDVGNRQEQSMYGPRALSWTRLNVATVVLLLHTS